MNATSFVIITLHCALLLGSCRCSAQEAAADDEPSSSAAVVFLTRMPQQNTLDFAKHISVELPVYMIANAIETKASEHHLNFSGTNLLFVNSSACYDAGYSQATSWRKPVAWDKALYYFTKVDAAYDFVWFIEDDVFIPSLDAFWHLHNAMLDQDADLAINSNVPNHDGGNHWHWGRARGRLDLPWYKSMACATGMSRRLLTLIADHAAAKGRLEFLEFFFNTLTMHNNLTLVNPPELGTIGYRREWTCEEVLDRPMNWFHPVKQKAGPGFSSREYLSKCMSERVDYSPPTLE